MTVSIFSLEHPDRSKTISGKERDIPLEHFRIGVKTIALEAFAAMPADCGVKSVFSLTKES